MERLPNFIIVSVNVLTQFLFHYLAQDEGHLTKSDINMEITILNFGLQFLNLGIGSVLLDADILKHGLNVNWYMNSGVFLLQTMIMNIGSSNSSEFGIMVLYLFARWKDRSFRLSLYEKVYIDKKDIRNEIKAKETVYKEGQDLKDNSESLSHDISNLTIDEDNIHEETNANTKYYKYLTNTKMKKQDEINKLYTGP
jgi:hypothetical protein